MNLILSLLTLVSVAIVHAQQGEKGNSIIPFPRVGRSDGSPMSAGLIPFPRIGRAGFQAVKRQLIPFPRVGKRPYWHVEPTYYTEYEDFSAPGMVDASSFGGVPAAAFPIQESDDGEVEKRGQNPNAGGGMWFGPRLGKRKKRSVDDVSSERHETVDMKTLFKILDNFKWAIVPVKERRNFTPRLGRRSSHEIHQRAQPFSPRLGRSKEFVSHEVEMEELRGKRGDGDDNEDNQDPPVGPPFSPRLGRAEPFSPRLGRSGPSE